MENYAKICVYAICKNESKFIDRWVSSLQGEADCVVVLDTGSTDDSVEKLKKYEPFVKVEQYDYIRNDGEFRFDKARNDSLKLVPFDADICVIFDLDHIPQAGWSKIIRERFNQGYQEVRGYIVDHSNGGTLDRWMSRNVHPNNPFWIWTKPIHEGIEYYGEGEVKYIFDENFIIDHYPDDTKDRSLYKDLLEKAHNDDPTDPYFGIYLGVELSRRYSREEAAKVFSSCIKTCNFDSEESKEIQFQCYINLAAMQIDNDPLGAIETIKAAINLGFSNRRMYSVLSTAYDKAEMYDEAIEALEKALTIQSNSNDWKEDQDCFNGSIEDRLSLLYYYHRNNPVKTIEYGKAALSYNPDDERLKTNLNFYYQRLRKMLGE